MGAPQGSRGGFNLGALSPCVRGGERLSLGRVWHARRTCEITRYDYENRGARDDEPRTGSRWCVQCSPARTRMADLDSAHVEAAAPESPE